MYQMVQEDQKQNLHTFTIFYIQEFYPSVGKKILKDAVLFAQTHTNISRKNIEMIFP